MAAAERTNRNVAVGAGRSVVQVSRPEVGAQNDHARIRDVDGLLDAAARRLGEILVTSLAHRDRLQAIADHHLGADPPRPPTSETAAVDAKVVPTTLLIQGLVETMDAAQQDILQQVCRLELL